MFKKILLISVVCLLVQLNSTAFDNVSSINNILNSYDFDRDSTVSISVKDKKTGKIIYSKNPYKYSNPASVLKLFTMAASLNELGEDYKFTTAFYKDKNNNLYIKLSADPMLTSNDLNILAQNLKQNHKGRINKIYIDDSIIDLIPYPMGWTNDDYWPNSPKISPYTADKNTVKVDFLLSENKKDVRIVQKDSYKFSFVNKLQISDKTDFTFVEDVFHNTVNIEGTISKNVIDKEIPVLNPKYFFCKKLNDALNKNGINFSEKFLFARVPQDVTIVAKFERPVDEVIKYVLRTSDNQAAETVFKVAGGKYAQKENPVKRDICCFGTTKSGISMFLNYLSGLELDIKQIKIRDGSGVSRYNAVNTDFLVSALSKMNFDYEKYLPTGGEGTLSKRMRELKDSVYFKTGTLFGTSSLSGIVKSCEDEYYFASIITSYNRNKSLIKAVEDEIVYEIYRRGSEYEEN